MSADPSNSRPPLLARPSAEEGEDMVRWRTGRKIGRTLYALVGDEPSDDDILIGMLDTPGLAHVVAMEHNLVLDQEAVKGCPDAEVCKSCPCAADDDACFPGERLRADGVAKDRRIAQLIRQVDRAVEDAYALAIALVTKPNKVPYDVEIEAAFNRVMELHRER